jgi:hypothetical protein
VIGWLAYTLTRPLGANLGAGWVSHRIIGPRWVLPSQGDLPHCDPRNCPGAWRAPTDVLDKTDQDRRQTVTVNTARERIMLAYYAVVAVATGAVLV